MHTCQHSGVVLHLRGTMVSPRKLFQNTIAVVFSHNPIPISCFSRLSGAGPQRWYTLQQTLLCLDLVGQPYTWHGRTTLVLTFPWILFLSALPSLNSFSPICKTVVKPNQLTPVWMCTTDIKPIFYRLPGGMQCWRQTDHSVIECWENTLPGVKDRRGKFLVCWVWWQRFVMGNWIWGLGKTELWGKNRN